MATTGILLHSVYTCHLFVPTCSTLRFSSCCTGISSDHQDATPIFPKTPSRIRSLRCNETFTSTDAHWEIAITRTSELTLVVTPILYERRRVDWAAAHHCPRNEGLSVLQPVIYITSLGVAATLRGMFQFNNPLEGALTAVRKQSCCC